MYIVNRYVVYLTCVLLVTLVRSEDYYRVVHSDRHVEVNSFFPLKYEPSETMGTYQSVYNETTYNGVMIVNSTSPKNAHFNVSFHCEVLADEFKNSVGKVKKSIATVDFNNRIHLLNCTKFYNKTCDHCYKPDGLLYLPLWNRSKVISPTIVYEGAVKKYKTKNNAICIKFNNSQRDYYLQLLDDVGNKWFSTNETHFYVRSMENIPSTATGIRATKIVTTPKTIVPENGEEHVNAVSKTTPKMKIPKSGTRDILPENTASSTTKVSKNINTISPKTKTTKNGIGVVTQGNITAKTTENAEEDVNASSKTTPKIMVQRNGKDDVDASSKITPKIMVLKNGEDVNVSSKTTPKIKLPTSNREEDANTSSRTTPKIEVRTNNTKKDVKTSSKTTPEIKVPNIGSRDEFLGSSTTSKPKKTTRKVKLPSKEISKSLVPTKSSTTPKAQTTISESKPDPSTLFTYDIKLLLIILIILVSLWIILTPLLIYCCKRRRASENSPNSPIISKTLVKSTYIEWLTSYGKLKASEEEGNRTEEVPNSAPEEIREEILHTKRNADSYDCVLLQYRKKNQEILTKDGFLTKDTRDSESDYLTPIECRAQLRESTISDGYMLYSSVRKNPNKELHKNESGSNQDAIDEGNYVVLTGKNHGDP